MLFGYALIVTVVDCCVSCSASLNVTKKINHPKQRLSMKLVFSKLRVIRTIYVTHAIYVSILVQRTDEGNLNDACKLLVFIRDK